CTMPENDLAPRERDVSETQAVGSPRPVAAMQAESGTAELPEGAKEKPVIDVHAPHGGLHTWKDFWIHLGTIALGLLIAISLEQTVEYFHHLHQRRDLEASILAECKTNK